MRAEGGAARRAADPGAVGELFGGLDGDARRRLTGRAAMCAG
jgi:hypothetical protein